MELNVDISGLENIMRPLRNFPNELEKALRYSLKRTGTHMSATLAKAIKGESYLKSGDIRASLNKPLIRGGSGVLSVEVKVAGRQLPIDKFKLIPNRQTARKGMRSKKWRSPSYRLGPRLPVESPGAEGGGSKPFVFLAKDKKILARRHGKKINRLYGYSVQYFSVFERVRKVTLEDSRTFFGKRLTHEVSYILGKLA